MHDNDFLHWNEISRQDMLNEVEAQNDFVSPNNIHDSVLNLKERPKKNNLKNKVLQSKKFIPGIVFYPKGFTSTLTTKEQARCLNALKLYQSGGTQQTSLTKLQQEDLEVYKSLQTKIQEEHAKFLNYVKNDWQKSLYRLEDIKIILFKYAHALWKSKLQKALSYSQYYMLYGNVRLVHDDPNHLTKVGIEQNVLSFGVPPVFACPTLVSKCILKLSKLPPLEAEYTYNSKLPVSRDGNVTSVLQTHHVDIVISMSGIKRLMDDSDHNTTWTIPLIVKKHECKSDDGGQVTKNVVYIDKPLPSQWPTKPVFKEQCYKRLLKTNFCITTEESQENLEEKIQNLNYSILPIEECDNKPCDLNPSNVVYSVWNMSRTSDENVLLKTRTENKAIKFLLRHKIDAYEHLPDGTKQPTILTPKVEYQLEHGAAICTKRELVRQWTDLFFKPFSHLYRVRILGSSSEVVHVESVSLQKINMEALQHHQYKPHERLGALFTIFSQLTTLDCGNYLLHHNERTGAFGDILKETTEDANVKFDLRKEYNPNYCSVRTAINRPWCPIDVSYILDVHSQFKKMPGMFKPSQYVTTKKRKENKKQKLRKAQRAKERMAKKTS